MTLPTPSHPLLILAMDHRASFAKQFGVESDVHAPENAGALTQMRAAKSLIYAGLQRATEQLPGANVGVLVDEELGADVLRQAATDGVTVALPVEKSGQRLFTTEYGDHTAEHLDRINPDYVKVLVRMNPDDDPADTEAQLTALKALDELLRKQGRALLYELLVSASEAQLHRAGNPENYDRDVRPELVAQVIAANQAAGVEPRLWKIEGLQTRAAAELVVAAAKAGGRDADCIVLGRDAAREQLDHWLSVAAPVPGFVGFAVGRSIWEDALSMYRRDQDDDAFTRAVAENYLHFARVYLDAS